MKNPMAELACSEYADHVYYTGMSKFFILEKKNIPKLNQLKDMNETCWGLWQSISCKIFRAAEESFKMNLKSFRMKYFLLNLFLICLSPRTLELSLLLAGWMRCCDRNCHLLSKVDSYFKQDLKLIFYYSNIQKHWRFSAFKGSLVSAFK